MLTSVLTSGSDVIEMTAMRTCGRVRAKAQPTTYRELTFFAPSSLLCVNKSTRFTWMVGRIE